MAGRRLAGGETVRRPARTRLRGARPADAQRRARGRVGAYAQVPLGVPHSPASAQVPLTHSPSKRHGSPVCSEASQ